MIDQSNSDGKDISTPRGPLAAFQKLRAAQDAESRAIEALLLYELEPRPNNVDTATRELDRAIEKHLAASEELSSLKDGRPAENGARS